jgi:mRNA-degrading endonuclease RelE of RelBE toxin-antitoxin system
LGEWLIKFHPDLFRDLDRLSKKDLEIFYNKKEKIKENPLRQKHLSGGENCYREPITSNIRLIYYVEGNVVWFLTVGKHDVAYKEYLKRLHSLRNRLV